MMKSVVAATIACCPLLFAGCISVNRIADTNPQITSVQTRATALEDRAARLETKVEALEKRLTALELPPAGAPMDEAAKVRRRAQLQRLLDELDAPEQP